MSGTIGTLNITAKNNANVNVLSYGDIGTVNSRSEGEGSKVNAAFAGYTGTANFESRTGGDSSVHQAGVMGTLNMLTDNHENGQWGQSNADLTTYAGSWTDAMNINTLHGSHFDGTINGSGNEATLTDNGDKTVARFEETSSYNKVSLNSINFGDLEASFKGWVNQLDAFADNSSKLNIHA